MIFTRDKGVLDKGWGGTYTSPFPNGKDISSLWYFAHADYVHCTAPTPSYPAMH